MKKAIKLSYFTIIFLFMSNSYAGIDLSDCDVISEKKIKYGFSYTFHLTLTGSDKTLGIEDVSVNYSTESDYDGTSTIPDFVFATKFKKDSYEIKPNSKVKVYEMIKPYSISYHPSKTSHNNLVFKYTVKYREKENDKWSFPKYHISCEKNAVEF